MPDFVYALHDFEPEHEDEISFRAGERIEVLERDDQYSDGWWQGRNLDGKSGLFPQAYTTSSPPPPPSAGLEPLREDPAEGQSTPQHGVMAATMTDVQEAIEQLGVKGEKDPDESSRRFSFASTRDDADTDHDHETDSHAEDADGHDEEWRKDTRKRLAAQAKREIKRREAAEADSHPHTPPIEAEISDESEGEDEEHHHSHHRHPSQFVTLADPSASSNSPLTATYPKQATVPAQNDHASDSELSAFPDSPKPSSSPLLLPARDSPPPQILARDPNPPAPPTPTTDPAQSPRGSGAFQNVLASSAQPATSPFYARSSTPRTPAFPMQPPVLSRPTSQSGTPLPVVARLPSPIPTPQHDRPTHSRTSTEVATMLPSPAASSFGASGAFVSTLSNGLPKSPVAPAPVALVSSIAASPQIRPITPRVHTIHPMEWSVDQVVDWLRSRGFDESVTSKFREHEITGDVLLELDANLLKELDIPAFGKRMRIANAIHDLQRPPSIVSSDHSVRNGIGGSHTAPTTGSSFSYGHHNKPSFSSSPFQTGPSPLVASVTSPESPPNSADLVYSERTRPESDPGSFIGGEALKGLAGLGFSVSEMPSKDRPVALGASVSEMPFKDRPAGLALSPSDGALKSRADAADKGSEKLAQKASYADERHVMSESETAKGLEERTKRKKVFGRATETADAKEVPAPVSTLRPASKRSSDSGSKTEHNRLSFFGGTLGKSRKPAPRLASGDVVESPSSSTSNNKALSRLYLSNSTKRPPSRAEILPAASPRSEKGERDAAVLRKRTTSNAPDAAARAITMAPGVSIVDQIPDADYSGWMRKRGERYNTWKMRFFILKANHLYYLKSRNETKLKGYVNILGYKVIADENANPGRYGFRIIHENGPTHYFSSEEQLVVREWMKALMKATIGRDYTRPVISSCNIPTIPLTVAQAMNPAPRPPSPTARDATQRALRRENPNQLSSRDARILMGLPSADLPVDGDPRKRHESFFTIDTVSSAPQEPVAPPIYSPVPPRPARDQRKPASPIANHTPNTDADLVQWVNSHLPPTLHVKDLGKSLSSGLVLFRLAESIKGRPSDVPDSIFPASPADERLEGLFKLFDFMLDNDVKTGSVSINDVRRGNRDQIVQLVHALKVWEDKRLSVVKSIGKGAIVAGPWIGNANNDGW